MVFYHGYVLFGKFKKNYSAAVELTNPPPPGYLRVCNNKLLPIYLTTNLLPLVCYLVTQTVTISWRLTRPSSLSHLFFKGFSLIQSVQVSWRGRPSPPATCPSPETTSCDTYTFIFLPASGFSPPRGFFSHQAELLRSDFALTITCFFQCHSEIQSPGKWQGMYPVAECWLHIHRALGLIPSMAKTKPSQEGNDGDQRGSGLANTDGPWKQKCEAPDGQTRPHRNSSMHALCCIKEGLWDNL